MLRAPRSAIPPGLRPVAASVARGAQACRSASPADGPDATRIALHRIGATKRPGRLFETGDRPVSGHRPGRRERVPAGRRRCGSNDQATRAFPRRRPTATTAPIPRPISNTLEGSGTDNGLKVTSGVLPMAGGEITTVCVPPSGGK